MDRIVIGHGGGGRLTDELLESVIVPALGCPWHGPEDAAELPGRPELRMTTDSFVVQPLQFPGGDIGSLAVHGTVNDLAAAGARPLALTLSLIIEEGFDIETLRKLLAAAGTAARAVPVTIAAGDTKVVPRGDADGVYITTAGVGEVVLPATPTAARPGDVIILSGPLAEHGIAVMSAREGIGFGTDVRSDSQSVWPIVHALATAGVHVHAMRDPTRGGVAAACNEIARTAGVSMLLNEPTIPVRAEVRAACEMLGLDPLTVANEGKLLVVLPEHKADRALEALRNLPEARGCGIIGRVCEPRNKPVYLETRYGLERIVDMPYGEELPRIC